MVKNILSQNIISALGIGSLPPEKQEEILESFGNIIFQAVLIRLMTELDEAGKDEFVKLLENSNGEDDAVLNFLKEKLPNLDEIVAQEVAKIKGESVDFLNQVVQ